MITRLILRLSVPLIGLVLLSISAANWIGNQTPTLMFSYLERGNYSSTFRLTDVNRGISSPMIGTNLTAYRWSPAGDYLLYEQLGRELPQWCLYELTSHDRRCWDIEDQVPVQFRLETWMEWSPDSRYLAGILQNEIQLWETETGETRVFYTCQGCSPSPGSIAWSPDSQRLIWFDNQNLMEGDIHTGEVETLLSEYPITGVSASPNVDYLMFQTSQDYTIWTYHLFDRTQQAVVQSLELDSPSRGDMAWSPDGDELMIMDSVEIHILTPDAVWTLDIPGASTQADWSPDGAYILFHCIRPQNLTICQMDAETGEIEPFIQVHTRSLYMPYSVREGAVLFTRPFSDHPGGFFVWADDTLHFVEVPGNELLEAQWR